MEKKSKTVSMEGSAPKDSPTKLTYEQLERVAQDLHSRCMQLQDNLAKAQEVIAGFNVVGMLLSIVEKGEYFSQEFADRCTAKIEEVVTDMLDTSEKAEAKDSE